MTKKELIAAIASRTSGSAEAPLTQGDVAKVIDGLAEVAQAELATGHGAEVRLEPIGRLYTETKNERKGMNPATHEMVTYPAKNVVKFKPAKALREAVEG